MSDNLEAIERQLDELPDAGEPPDGSEQALAQVFARKSQHKFRWTPGIDWMRNCGTHWERDNALQRYTVAKQVCAEASQETTKEAMKYRLASAGTANAVLSLARSEPSISTPITEWDKNSMLLNTPGGVYDLETGKQALGGHLFRHVTAVAPDAGQGWPVWHQFLTQVFTGDDDVIEFIQRLSGYCLTGDTREQKLFFMHGSGANGKSVLLNVWREMVGSYAHNLPSEALMSQRHESHPTLYASLFGKRLAISSEIEGNARWAESKIKELTGEETMTARYMRQDFFEFPVTHKHVIAGNYKPRLKGDDYAMVRRMVLIPFTQVFKGKQRDSRLPEKLRHEYPGILAWCIDGARKWAQDGLRIPDSIANASAEYMKEHDDIAMWIDDCCRTGPGIQSASADLYASFKQWKESAGEHAASKHSFTQQLGKKGFEGCRVGSGSDRKRGFVGLVVNPTAGDYYGAKYGDL